LTDILTAQAGKSMPMIRCAGVAAPRTRTASAGVSALRLGAWCERIDGRKLHLRGEIHDGETLIAEGRALFIHVDVAHWEASGQPLPSSWQGWGDTANA
jgi:acyl-CoA thioesterase FadM